MSCITEGFVGQILPVGRLRQLVDQGMGTAFKRLFSRVHNKLTMRSAILRRLVTKSTASIDIAERGRGLVLRSQFLVLQDVTPLLLLAWLGAELMNKPK